MIVQHLKYTTFLFFIFLNYLILIQRSKEDLIFRNASFTDSSNVGFGLQTPYFWNIAKDKDVTFLQDFIKTTNLYYLAEYRQDFLNSF